MVELGSWKIECGKHIKAWLNNNKLFVYSIVGAAVRYTLFRPFSPAALLVTVLIPFSVVVGSLVLFYRTFRPWQAAGAIIEAPSPPPPSSFSLGQLRPGLSFPFCPLHATPQKMINNGHGTLRAARSAAAGISILRGIVILRENRCEKNNNNNTTTKLKLKRAKEKLDFN